MTTLIKDITAAMGESFTHTQLEEIKTRLSSQLVVPNNLFMDDPSGILIGPGMAIFLAVRNPPKYFEPDLVTHWLKKYRQDKAKVWGRMVSTIEGRCVRRAAARYHRSVCAINPHTTRKLVAIDILEHAIPIAIAKRQSAVDFL